MKNARRQAILASTAFVTLAIVAAAVLAARG
jgi:hypothetical protein